LPEVVSEYPTNELNDNYNYYYEELKNYWDTASRQSRKIKNRLEKQYYYYTIHPKDIEPSLQARILEINDIWLEQFKSNDKKSKQTLSYVENVFKHKLYWDNLKFIIYVNKETGIVEAYDYLEVWGDVGIAAAGKAIIPKVSTFKWVTINIVNILHLMGAKYCMLGGANFYIDGQIQKGGNPGLLKAKTSIPYEQTFTWVYRFNPKKFAAVDISDDVSALF
jgi:hypothetical protein